MSDPTKLYRYYDSAGVLLYVGISKNALQRLTEHEAGKSWQENIANVRIETFPDRDAAHTAERRAIAAENPTQNLIRYAANTAAQAKARAPRLNPSRDSLNARCLAALVSMYEEMHWGDFIEKFSDEHGLVTLAFANTDRIKALSDGWMMDAAYWLERGGRRVTCTQTWDDEQITVSLVPDRCTAKQVAEYGLFQHDALHDELCAGVASF
jgi:predicted GIY-YIG superfamily endonuclease